MKVQQQKMKSEAVESANPHLEQMLADLLAEDSNLALAELVELLKEADGW